MARGKQGRAAAAAKAATGPDGGKKGRGAAAASGPGAKQQEEEEAEGELAKFEVEPGVFYVRSIKGYQPAKGKKPEKCGALGAELGVPVGRGWGEG